MTTHDPRPGLPEHTGTYDIRLRGQLDHHWAERLGAPELMHEQGGITLLRGVTADQAALHGLLQRIRDLGVSLISVTHVPSNPRN